MPPLPFELVNLTSKDTWTTRVTEITRIASRYCKPIFERVWALVGLIATFVVPTVLYRVILDRLQSNGDDYDEELTEAKVISFVLFVIVPLVFFAPMAIWKYTGYVRVNAMVKHWGKEDERTAGPGAPLPSWKVKTPGVFRDVITLVISVPLVSQTSGFHQDVYPPAYVGRPVGAAPVYHDVMKADYSNGSLAPASFGDVPLYREEKYSMV